MNQMTLFFKKVIYKNNNYLINTHQRYQIAPFFFKLSWGSMPPDPLAKGMASLSCGYVQRIALTLMTIND